jgi:hypothetical protein
LARRRTYFSQLLNVQGKMMLGWLKYIQQNHYCLSLVFLRLRWLLTRSKGTSHQVGHIPQKMIKTEGSTFCSEIHTLNNSIWNKEELPRVAVHHIIIIYFI